MEGDFIRPPRRPVGYDGGRPLPQASQRPAQPMPVTDLRPQPAPSPQPFTTPPAPAQPYQPPQPASLSQPAPTQPKAESKPTTAELIAQHEQQAKAAKPSHRKLVLAAAGLVVIIAVTIMFSHHAPAKKTGPFPASISSSQITIPVYYPKDLPVGFKVSGSKAVKQDNLNYVVTNTNNESFYVNIESIPVGYDFAAFNKRFTNPTTYQTPIGTATAGLMNNQLVCSIQTAKSWVMINSTATKSTADMETIAKALKPVTL